MGRDDGDCRNAKMSIESQIKKTKHEMFRRLYMKRRIDSDYESDWQEIPSKYIKKFGSVSTEIDSIRANFYKTSGLTFECINNDGYFSDIGESKSFFYNADTLYKTKVKIECGYIENTTYGADKEYPSNSTIFIGLLDTSYKYAENARLVFKANQLSSVFMDVDAELLPDMDKTATASEIITKIKDFQDDSSDYFFRHYITSSSWNIETTTTYYNFAKDVTLSRLSCWGLMKLLAEAENKLLYIDREGDFYFKSKELDDSTASYHFSGLSDGDKTYGHNIIGKLSVNNSLQKVYNKIIIKFDKTNTTTSYVIKKEKWEYGDNTSPFLYGVRLYEYTNGYLNHDTAEVIATNILNEYAYPKEEITFSAKYSPQLSVNDHVTVTYRTRHYQSGDLWGFFEWGKGAWGNRTGYNIDIYNQSIKILKIKHNFDKYNTVITGRVI